MKKIELNNRGTILALSIAISVLLWSYVMGDINPQINRNFAGVSVNVIHSEDDDLVVTSEIEPKVDVRVTGRRNDVYEIRRSDMMFTLDLSDYGEGTHMVEIGHDVNMGTANVKIDYNPKEFEVKIEKLVKKTLAVELDIAGRFPSGITKERIRLRTKEVEVVGPRSSVESIERLKVSLNTSDLVGKDKLELDIIPVNSNGEVVSDVELSQYKATVDILKQDANMARVEPSIVGEVAEGYELVSVESNPASVEIDTDTGTRLESIKTENIDVNGLSEDREVEVALIVPEDVTLVGSENVVVSIKVTTVEDGEGDVEEGSESQIESMSISYNTSELLISNLDDSFKIANKDELTESLEVTIEGEKSIMDDFKLADLVLGIDFSNIVETGIHQVEVTPITVKEGIVIKSIAPRNLRVLIEKID